jgi:hypothetical protein
VSIHQLRSAVRATNSNDVKVIREYLQDKGRSEHFEDAALVVKLGGIWMRSVAERNFSGYEESNISLIGGGDFLFLPGTSTINFTPASRLTVCIVRID